MAVEITYDEALIEEIAAKVRPSRSEQERTVGCGAEDR